METHCGDNTISKVSKKIQELKVRKIRSLRVEAWKMFDKKRTNYETALKLDASSDDIEKYRIEYSKVKNLDNFVEMYYKYKDSLPFIVGKYHELKELNISADQLFKANILAARLPALQFEIQSLCQNRDNLRLDYLERQKEYRDIEAYLSSMKSERRRSRSALRHLRRMISKDCKEAQGMLITVLDEIMKDRSKFLWLALLAVARAMSELPAESIFRNLSYLNTFLNNYIVNKYSYPRDSEIMTNARRLYDSYCQEIVKDKIHYTSPVANTRVDNVPG